MIANESVPVPGLLNINIFFQMKYTEAVSPNSIRKLLWFEITKMLTAVLKKNVVLLKCIGTLLFPVGNASEPAAMRCFAVITAATSSSSDAQRCRFVQQNVVDDSKHSCSAQLCSGARVMVSRHRINWSLQLTERRASGKLRTVVLRTAPDAYE